MKEGYFHEHSIYILSSEDVKVITALYKNNFMIF